MATGRRRAVVLGGGLQGVSSALALASRGHHVTLVDRHSRPMLGASRRGEGKVHLGYVYGNEPGRATARLMAQGAAVFASSLDEWLPRPLDWRSLRSTPFHYAVAESTMVSADDLAEHYAVVDTAVREALDLEDSLRPARALPASYLGLRAHELARTQRLEVRHPAYTRHVTDVFATPEVAVDPNRLADALSAALAPSGIDWVGCSSVDGVEAAAGGWRVHLAPGEGHALPSDRDPVARTLEADLVVNCLWDGRLAVDASLGLAPEQPWNYRLKHGVVGRSSVPLASTTFALGPLGDVVQRSDGHCYLSWYPECMTQWSDALQPPSEWRPAMRGEETSEEQLERARLTIAGLAHLMPDVVHVAATTAAAGVIVAWGATDIDDPASRLHSRSEIGVHTHAGLDGYISIDTGKLTTAPLFARQLLDVVGALG